MFPRTADVRPSFSSIPPPVSLLDDASLFLDFDGTLVDLADRPDLVVVGPGVTGLLARLGDRLGGRLAVVSGRPAADIRRLLGGSVLAIGGSHGLEIEWEDGRHDGGEPPSALGPVGEAFDRLAHAHPGSLVERKPFGVAFHYRAIPQVEPHATAIAASLAAETGLVLQPGKMMIELRVGDADKGSAIRAFMGAPPRIGTKPVFIGDDLTDEPAFEAAAALGGAGILVGERRGTAARYRLGDVAATLAWLEAAAA